LAQNNSTNVANSSECHIPVLTAVILKTAFFWDVTPRPLIKGYRGFEGLLCCHLQVQAVSSLFKDCFSLMMKSQQTLKRG